jgi:hypothetical protein
LGATKYVEILGYETAPHMTEAIRMAKETVHHEPQ